MHRKKHHCQCYHYQSKIDEKFALNVFFYQCKSMFDKVAVARIKLTVATCVDWQQCCRYWITRPDRKAYSRLNSAYHGFGQAEICNGGSVLGRVNFRYCPSCLKNDALFTSGKNLLRYNHLR